MNKPCLYLRTSTDALQQNGTDAQRHALLQWCRGAAVEVPEPDWFSDVGFTGRKMTRPGFDAMLTKIKAGEYDTLVAYSLSRLGLKMSKRPVKWPSLGTRWMNVIWKRPTGKSCLLKGTNDHDTRIQSRRLHRPAR